MPDGRVVRSGRTVRRAMGWWSPAVHGLLGYLESVDFPYSPRLLDVEQTADGPVEVLSHLDGESGQACLTKPADPAALRAMARLLRSYHDAIAGYRPPADARWATVTGAPTGSEVLCHGDFAPWNLTWRGSEPVGIIDWDTVVPGPRSYDVCYALEYVTPFRDDDWAVRYHGLTTPIDRPGRITAFLDAYGIEIPDVVGEVAAVQRAGIAHVERLAAGGSARHRQWIAEGYLPQIAERARWTQTHRALLE